MKIRAKNYLTNQESVFDSVLAHQKPKATLDKYQK